MKSPDPLDPRLTPRVEELFHAAADLPAGDRTVFLDLSCHGDDELKRAVHDLLKLESLPDVLPAGSALEFEATRSAAELAEEPSGRRFGPYRVRERIGAGGMGVVYKAVRDDDFQKTVAIKVLPCGFETASRVESFYRERQILATLEHPNIAALLDGGATIDGAPYLVMEYVEGSPLDRFAEEHALSMEERLRLFLQVCGAVEYAHRRLVVHCDLKPSNVLVGSGGVPKLLDFGISKLLDGTLLRGGTLPLLTPRYASPEQINGAPVTTASDVYSLGVVLYALLTGQPPYAASDDPRELARAVCETELDLAARRELAPDLRNIIAMATRKEPERRYASVDRLAADVQAFLESRPVQARRQTPAYRASRFLRRNRVSVAAATLAVAGLTAGFASSWVESRKANRRFEEVRGLAHYLFYDLYDSVVETTSSVRLRKSMIDRGSVYLDRLLREAGRDPALLLNIAQTYVRLGAIQGLPLGPNLGDTSGALSSFGKAQSILESLVTQRPSDITARAELYGVSQQTGAVLLRAGRMDEAQQMFDRAVAIATELRRLEPHNGERAFQFASAMIASGQSLDQRGEALRSAPIVRESLATYQSAMDVLMARPAINQLVLLHNIAICHFHISYAHWHLAEITGDSSELEATLDHQLRGAEIVRQLAQAEPKRARFARSVADNLNDIGHTLTKLGRFPEAEVKFRDSLARFEAIAARDPHNNEAQQDVGNVCWWYAESLALSGRTREARALAERAAAIYDRIVAQDPANADVKKARAAVAALLAATGNPPGTRAVPRRAPASR